MLTIRIISLIMISLLLNSCSKEPSEKRHFGDNTISFLINDNLWQNSDEYNNNGSINGTANESMYVIYTSSADAYSVVGKIWGKSVLYLGMVNRNADNDFLLGHGHGQFSSLLDPFNQNTISLSLDNKIYISRENEGFISITKDEYDAEINIRHFEGKFEATLYNIDDPSDIINIVDGKFNN